MRVYLREKAAYMLFRNFCVFIYVKKGLMDAELYTITITACYLLYIIMASTLYFIRVNKIYNPAMASWVKAI